MASLITDGQREVFVRRVRLEMARLGLTREALAAQAGCKERTLGNLLAGERVRDATAARIAAVLSIALDDLFGSPADLAGGRKATAQEGRAADAYGGYQLAAFESYIGTYTAYRWVFSDSGEIQRSIYEIDWDDELSRLRFFELQRYESAAKRAVSSSHAGGIHISPMTGLLHLLTTYQGALRLVTLSRFRLGDNRLRGAILTQSDREMYFQPAVSTIYLEKLAGRRKTGDLERMIGRLTSKHEGYAEAAAELRSIGDLAVYFAGIDRSSAAASAP